MGQLVRFDVDRALISLDCVFAGQYDGVTAGSGLQPGEPFNITVLSPSFAWRGYALVALRRWADESTLLDLHLSQRDCGPRASISDGETTTVFDIWPTPYG